jgi:hypothetical protein
MVKQHNDYYTYAFLREGGTPYYIGKGRGKRIYSPNRLINLPTDKSRILFLKKGLTEVEAFKHEVYMIFVLGRKDTGTGILRNLTNGGEGSSGAVRSKETRNKISKANKNPSEKTRRKMSDSGKVKNFSEEHRKNLSESMSGENNPMFGIPRPEETKKKISETLSGKFLGALHPRSKAIIAIKPDGTELHFGSCHEVARELGISQGHLSGRYLKTGHVLTRGPFKGWQFAHENL